MYAGAYLSQTGAQHTRHDSSHSSHSESLSTSPIRQGGCRQPFIRNSLDDDDDEEMDQQETEVLEVLKNAGAKSELANCETVRGWKFGTRVCVFQSSYIFVVKSR